MTEGYMGGEPDVYTYAHVNTKYEPYNPWAFKNLGPMMVLGGAVLAFAQWVGLKWLEEQQAPQWAEVHQALEKCERNDADIVVYQLENARYIRDVIAVLAASSSAKLPARPPELERSMHKIREIKD